MQTEASIIKQVRYWVLNTVVGLNFCPFARKPLEDEAINFCIVGSSKKKQVLEMLLQQCALLQENTDLATSLLILDQGYADFYDYLDILEVAQELMALEGYEGVFQLASFHPDYCFDGLDIDDAANFTNRSPYPILHLIREQELEDLLEHYPNPEDIPLRNIDFARDKGVEVLQRLLEQAKAL